MWLSRFVNALLFIDGRSAITAPLDITDNELIAILSQIPEAWHKAGYEDR